MQDFILKQRDYDKVPDLLTSVVPSLLESEEYQRLDPEVRKVPGIVGAAFAGYFERLQETDSKSDVLERCYAVIEQMACSSDPEVQNLVVTEIFENLHSEGERLRRIKERLGPESRRLYERWMK